MMAHDSPCWGALPVNQVAGRIERYAGELFEGWKSHVTVGALQSVEKPSK
jgi:hypothetical protein